jgi:hypothetical protein
MIAGKDWGMAGKKTKVKDYDQFQLRLPPGIRDRIKAKADRAGMSMNEAIVWVLEREFPEPLSFEKRISELADMVALLKTDDYHEAVDSLVQEIQMTLDGISAGKIAAKTDFRKLVRDRWARWQEEEYEDLYAAQERPWEAIDNPSEDDERGT